MGYRVLQVCTSGLHMRRTRVGEVPALSDRRTSSVQGGVEEEEYKKEAGWPSQRQGFFLLHLNVRFIFIP